MFRKLTINSSVNRESESCQHKNKEKVIVFIYLYGLNVFGWSVPQS